MKLSIGIVGLPNVGKSTLFQALTKHTVDIANYPFTTIDKNVGVVQVPDERLEKVARIIGSSHVFPTIIEFLDIAGLVKGAHKGEGLGNQFLAHIREVDGILHVVRNFENPDVIHIEKNIDPARDIEIVNSELLLKDRETVQKRLARIEEDGKRGKKEAMEEQSVLENLLKELHGGNSAAVFLEKYPQAQKIIQDLFLLTAKPILYVINSPSQNLPQDLLEKFQNLRAQFLVLNFKEELELGELSENERMELGVEPRLPELIRKSYELLDLITFFTGNEKETRAWTIKRGMTVVKAGGIIHSDFETKFIKAMVIPWDMLVKAGSYREAYARGWVRTEGKEYVVQDGDVIEIKHG